MEKSYEINSKQEVSRWKKEITDKRPRGLQGESSMAGEVLTG